MVAGIAQQVADHESRRIVMDRHHHPFLVAIVKDRLGAGVGNGNPREPDDIAGRLARDSGLGARELKQAFDQQGQPVQCGGHAFWCVRVGHAPGHQLRLCRGGCDRCAQFMCGIGGKQPLGIDVIAQALQIIVQRGGYGRNLAWQGRCGNRGKVRGLARFQLLGKPGRGAKRRGRCAADNEQRDQQDRQHQQQHGAHAFQQFIAPPFAALSGFDDQADAGVGQTIDAPFAERLAAVLVKRGPVGGDHLAAMVDDPNVRTHVERVQTRAAGRLIKRR